jgi:hypothetical protein
VRIFLRCNHNHAFHYVTQVLQSIVLSLQNLRFWEIFGQYVYKNFNDSQTWVKMNHTGPSLSVHCVAKHRYNREALCSKLNFALRFPPFSLLSHLFSHKKRISYIIFVCHLACTSVKRCITILIQMVWPRISSTTTFCRGLIFFR